jgi:hypothetical protein
LLSVVELASKFYFEHHASKAPVEVFEHGAVSEVEQKDMVGRPADIATLSQVI